jgi:5-methylcytosine-specific restriction protein A
MADNRFYASKRWRDLRSLKLSHNPLCERCEADGLTVLAVHVHHTKARKAHPALELELTNLESLCIPCHTKEENKRR